ncbi:hypothetical protein ACPPVU_13870 [Mucilaginibacter sp. McL0603]|uniref:hypothetical protein n=1 Tax=Mucilaginibacter sp. McL0603 TaxID=3415670 RepID=UPI003CF37189
MLNIDIPSNGASGLTFNQLEKYNIPAPPNGFSSEINNNVIIHFDDEQQAIDYAHDLDEYSNSIESESQEFNIIADIIKAVGDDEFVQAYIQS